MMGWIERLPEVGTPILKKRDAIAAKMERAKELEAQAQALRAEAYRDSLELESNVRTLWTDDDVNQAKRAFCI